MISIGLLTAIMVYCQVPPSMFNPTGISNSCVKSKLSCVTKVTTTENKPLQAQYVDTLVFGLCIEESDAKAWGLKK